LKIFFDTNILVYSYDNSDEAKHINAFNLISNSIFKESIVISSQVVNEFIVIMTTKVKHPITIDEAEKFITKFKINFEIRETRMEDIEKAIGLHKNQKFSYWDSLIIAAAINAGAEILYSEDLQHGRIINKLKIINPFQK
jgi:predicted nucleic acid-binding protein